jgi:hypothetical protein
LTTDEICLGVKADHPIEQIAISIEGNGIPLRINPAKPGETVFVSIGRLPPGQQTLDFTARTLRNGEAVDRHGHLDVSVRKPRPWLAGVIPQGPLSVFLDPASPSLENLWDGRLSVEINGPPGRTARGSFAFYDRSSASPRLERELQGLQLPTTPEQWNNYFDVIRQDKQVQQAYDFSHACKVTLDAAELGAFSFRAYRRHLEAIFVRYSDVLADPETWAHRINEFLGGGLDERAMVEIVDPDLYRNRA